MNKFFYIWEEIKSTFWFIPILNILFAISVAIVLIYVDNNVHYQPTGLLQYLFTGSAASARSVLSTISGAMVGLTGTVFSITLVVLTLASSQFGSRLLRNFMHEKINQIVLGAYIATYVYCLIVLNSIKESESISFIPTFSVFAALISAVANIILLIIFIHHIAISIQADHVISDINRALSHNIKVLFPESIGVEWVEEDETSDDSYKEKYAQSTPVLSLKSGYLQLLDIESIYKLAIEHDLVILFNKRPGDFLVQDAEIGSIFSKEPVTPAFIGRVQKTLLAGSVRTPLQDAEYSVHQMVEIAARALSPGINDPYTAISCIDNLTSTLCYLTSVKFPSKYRYDEEGHLRVVSHPLTFEGILNTSFNQIRQYSKGSPSVIIRLMEALITIHTISQKNRDKQSITRQAAMVLAIAEKSFDEEKDLIDLREKSRLIM